MRRHVLGTAVAAALLSLASSGHAAPAPVSFTDPEGDANFTAQAAPDKTAPVGNQDYADVTKVTWEPVYTVRVVNRKTIRTVTGFKVTTTLKAAPTPPSGTQLVYRMLSTPPCGDPDTSFFGVVYYTAVPSDPTQPQAAIRDNCTGATRLTKIALPNISGNTIAWVVPLSAIPKDLKFKTGTKLTNLRFEVREIEDLKGQKTPDQIPLGYGGQYGFGVGIVDNGASTATYEVM